MKQCLRSGSILKVESINIHWFVRHGVGGEEATRYVDHLPRQWNHELIFKWQHQQECQYRVIRFPLINTANFWHLHSFLDQVTSWCSSLKWSRNVSFGFKCLISIMCVYQGCGFLYSHVTNAQQAYSYKYWFRSRIWSNSQLAKSQCCSNPSFLRFFFA